MSFVEFNLDRSGNRDIFVIEGKLLLTVFRL